MQSSRSTRIPKGTLSKMLSTLDNRPMEEEFENMDNVPQPGRFCITRSVSQRTWHQQRIGLEHQCFGGGWQMKTPSEIKKTNTSHSPNQVEYFSDEPALPKTKEIRILPKKKKKVEWNLKTQPKGFMPVAPHKKTQSDQNLLKKAKHKPIILPVIKTEKQEESVMMDYSINGFSVFSSEHSTDDLEEIVNHDSNVCHRTQQTSKSLLDSGNQTPEPKPPTELVVQRRPPNLLPVKPKGYQKYPTLRKNATERVLTIRETKSLTKSPLLPKGKTQTPSKSKSPVMARSVTIPRPPNEAERITTPNDVRERRLQRELNSVQTSINRIRINRRQNIEVFPISVSTANHTIVQTRHLLFDQDEPQQKAKMLQEQVGKFIKPPNQPNKTEQESQIFEPVKVPKHMLQQKSNPRLKNMQKSVSQWSYNNKEAYGLPEENIISVQINSTQPMEASKANIINLEKHAEILSKHRQQLQESITRKVQSLQVFKRFSKLEKDQYASYESTNSQLKRNADKRAIHFTRQRY